VGSSLHVEIHVRVNVQDVQGVSFWVVATIDPNIDSRAEKTLVSVGEIILTELRLKRFGGKGLAVHVESHEIAVEMLKIVR
jgi:hypothetical protein